MTEAIGVGPLVFTVALVALAGGVVTALAAASFLRRRGLPDPEPALWWLLLATLVVARLVFVARWWDSYRIAPLGILDVRDGGFDVVAGLLTVTIGVLMLAPWRRWRTALPIAAVCGLAVWGLVFGAVGALDKATHPPLPNLTLQDIDGQPVALASLVGQPLVVNLWATWCPPCRREMPALVAAERARRDVRFVFVDQGESAATVRQYLAAHRLHPRHALLDGASDLSAHYNVRGYPTTLFLAADGQLRDVQVGELSSATLAARLARLTASTASAARGVAAPAR